jgi:hypothetical protein
MILSGETNLYCYCANNPVNMLDDARYWPKSAKKLLISAAVIATVAAAATGLVAVVAASALKGAISGAVYGTLGALL